MKHWMLYSFVALLVTGSVGSLWYANREPVSYDFVLASEDTIASWEFKGLYKDNAELVTRAQNEIGRLEVLLENEKDDFPEYELYVSIANQYDLLGNGEKEYQYLKYALALDSQNTGLAWNNLGDLLEKLGAYHSARTAFEKGIAAQPLPQYRQVYFEFLMKHYPGDPAIAIEKAVLDNK
ncbi:MAG: hypothetical protein Q7J45_02330 [bacterium]|nr:hypothetical protein [bacterium]